MSDETEIGSSGASDRPGHTGGSSGEQSPLQARAAFLKNRSWELVVGLNRGACARGGAQHGQNSESYGALEADWRRRQGEISTLDEAIEFLRQCHRRAPFLFFNGNTFADVGRTIVDFVFAELPTTRRRELMSAVAHYIAGVLDHQSLEQSINELCAAAELQPGDRVKTFRGSMSGTIVSVLPDGRVVWRTDSGAELTGLPESLIRLEGK